MTAPITAEQMPSGSMQRYLQQNQLEDLLDWQEQASDVDGRAVGEPFYIITGESREAIEFALTELVRINEADPVVQQIREAHELPLDAAIFLGQEETK